MTKSKTISILTCGILLLFILGTIGVGYYYFKDKIQENPFNPGKPLSKFSVELNETKFKTNNTNSVVLNKDEEIKFSVSEKFEVSIIPNTKNEDDFEVTINNEEKYSFGRTDNYTESFNLRITESDFVLNIPKNTTMYSILKQKHSANRVQVNKNCDTAKTTYFAILIKSIEGKENILIPFTFESFYGKDDIQGIILDKEGVILI